ncbi:hypothetical protein BJX70DRAFT_400763 [Aspergillus crustosus]
MSLSSDDHVTLLLSCIQRSTAGKIDFDAVAKDCNIKTSGAASKRYSRLTKAHRDAMANGGTSAADSSGKDNTESQDQSSQAAATTDQSNVPPTASKPGRKRKAAPKAGDDAQSPRKRGRPAGKAAKGVTKGKGKVVVKKEEEEDDENDMEDLEDEQEEAGESSFPADIKVKKEEAEDQEADQDEDGNEGQRVDSEMEDSESAYC